MERAIGLLGIAGMLFVAWAVSTHRRAIDWRTVGVGMALQVLIAFVCLQTRLGAAAFVMLNDAAVVFIGAAEAGIEFVFGAWPTQVMGTDGKPLGLPFVFAIRVLPVIIFMSSVFSVLYHFGVLQRLVGVLARALRWALPISGAESLATIS